MNDSDDLKKTENEVTRLSVAIEKEMFNLCLNTDSRYKNKYRSLMFNLKDPKNKVSGHERTLVFSVEYTRCSGRGGDSPTRFTLMSPPVEMLNSPCCVSQGLFYRVVGGEVSPFRLVRLSAEELLSKEISEWKKPDGAEVSVTSLELKRQVDFELKERGFFFKRETVLRDVCDCYSICGCPL